MLFWPSYFTLLWLGDKNNPGKFFWNRFLAQIRPFLHTFSSTGDNSGFTSEIWKSAKNHSECVKNCWKSLVTISFGFWIPIVFILVLKRPKNCIFGSKYWACWRQKCYRNPFLGPFETPKEFGRHCHRYLGKVKFFWVIWITKRWQKREFCSGGALKAPPPLMVGLKRLSLDGPFWKILSHLISMGSNAPFV